MKKKFVDLIFLNEVNNVACTNFYYLIKIKYGDLLKNYIFYFDLYDVLEYYEKDEVTEDEIDEYASEVAYGFFESASIRDCDESVERYLKGCSNYYREWFYNKFC